MICRSLKFFNSQCRRNIYFLLDRNNAPPLIKLQTRSTILSNITPDDEVITIVNLPVDENDFIMKDSVYLHEPIIVNKYHYSKNYLLINGAIFNLFDRVNIRKGFLYDFYEMRRLIRVFCSSGSFEGLVWMYKSLVHHEKRPYRRDGPEISSSSEFIKSLEKASTWHYKMLTQMLKNKE